MSRRELLLELFHAGLRAVDGCAAVERSLRDDDPGGSRWTVIAAGKAACAMAEGARAALGARIVRGLCVTKQAHGRSLPGFEVREAAHPVPDHRGEQAAAEALSMAGELGESDALLCLLSGGASALLVSPVAGVSLSEKRTVTDLLLRSGVDITALNTVRRRLSRIKGGGLARAASPARVLTLAVSDVAGDRPEAIGSGPTAADPTGHADALEVLGRAGIVDHVPPAVLAHLRGADPAQPSQGGEYRVVASLEGALRAIEREARARGRRVRSPGRVLDADVRVCASDLLRRIAEHDDADLLLAGGEPTVVVRGDGRGGRAQELALAFALSLDPDSPATALFAGTDGSDGPTDAAGAIVDAGTRQRAADAGLDAADHLARNDSHPLLAASGDLIVTGPTGTNVGDLALILV